MTGIVAVFDFDKTIVDCDSDNWVVDELGFSARFDQLLHTLPWNAMMNKLMGEMHSGGIEIEKIAEVLRRIPIHPRVVPAIRAAHAFGCDLRIVSDANMFFIATILEHLGITELFSEINTNPGFVDEEGRLRILLYHDFKTCPHGCPLCPPNMCKGLILERIRASAYAENKRIIYSGDGAGDYCPTLKLGERDFVMPRKDYPLWQLMLKNPSLIKAEVHEWTDGQNQEVGLTGIIQRVISEEEEEKRPCSTTRSATASSVPDCKLQTIAVAHEALPPVLPVPQ